MSVATMARCRECGRGFNLADAADADEWAYGHDCEDAGEDDGPDPRTCEHLLTGPWSPAGYECSKCGARVIEWADDE